MKVYKGLFICVLITLSFSVNSQILINEVMATNGSSLLETDYYNFPDWLEIFNNGTSSVNLNNYYISDDKTVLKKWKLPTYTLAAKGYYIIYCDKEASGRHTNFGLDSDGETVYLCTSDGTLIDSVHYNSQFSNVSSGRNPSNLFQWLYCTTPTPGNVNQITTAVRTSPKAIYSVPEGRLSSTKSLTLSGNIIRYSTDGSIPTNQSTLYTQPFTINKTMVVKTRTFADGYLSGEITANTYFVNEHEFTLPVVSLSLNPLYLTDNTIGIYVYGTNGSSQVGNCKAVANFNQNWEREAYFEYFDESGVRQIAQPVGVKISGGCTRFSELKSMSVLARDKYGDSDFDYVFFKQKPEINKFKSILLRNSGNDFNDHHLRDAFLQNCVCNSIDIEYQAYQPTIFYMNGVYYGIINLREKTDEDYFLSNYGLETEEIDYLEGKLMTSNDNFEYLGITVGSDVEYKDMINLVSSSNMAIDANYEQVASQIDMQEYLNYMATQIYIANTDWPGNNIKFWKAKNGGKWRWFLFDTDFGFNAVSSSHQTIEFATQTDGPIWPNPDWSTLLFRNLLKNEGFQKEFVKTMMTIRSTCFDPDWCSYLVDSLAANIEFEMTYHKNKYGGSVSSWKGRLESLKSYAIGRYNFIPGYLQTYFGINSSEVTVSINNLNQMQGGVLVNQARIMKYPFSMTTFEYLPLELKAVPEKGYRFKHWQYAGQVSNKNIIPLNSEWSYLDEATAYPNNWKDISFDDASWKNGTAQLGYGDGDETTVISYGTDASNKIPTALFRKKFNLTDTAGITNLKISVLVDDGAVVYLNGQEVGRYNMPDGTIEFTTLASSTNEDVTVDFDISKELLIIGDNVVVCEIHQGSASSSDLSFNLSMYYTYEEVVGGIRIYSTNPVITNDQTIAISLEPVFEPIEKIYDIFLNEIAPVSSNFLDDMDEKSGFVELYNNNSEAVALYGFYLSDDKENLTRYALPDSLVIPANGFLTFYADGQGKQGELHLPFKLSTNGEPILLSQKVGSNLEIIDSVSFSFLVQNYSYGKYSDGTGKWQYMKNMTPGQPNDPEKLVIGIEETLISQNITLYPNPSDGRINILFDTERMTNIYYTFDLIDISGKKVTGQYPLNEPYNQFDFSYLNNGIYFCRIMKGNQLVKTVKLVIGK